MFNLIYFSGAEILNERMFKVWLYYRPIYYFTKLYRRELKYVINGMFTIADDVIKEKDEACKLLGKTVETYDEKPSNYEYRKPQIFIDQLYKMRNIFSPKEIKDEINTIIAAVSHIINRKQFSCVNNLFQGSRNISINNVSSTSYACNASRCSR